MGLNGKSSQEYPVNAGVTQGFILGLTDMLIILLCTLSVTMPLICGNSWNWLLNLYLICETLWTGAGSGL